MSRQPTTARRSDGGGSRAGSVGTVRGLAVIVALLCIIGLLMVLSASSVTALESQGSSWHFFKRQALWMAVGVLVFAALAVVDYRRLRPLAELAAVAAIVLLLVVRLTPLGVRVNGSVRWIALGGVNLQPSELAKLALLIFAADLLARRRHQLADPRAVMRPVLAALGIVTLLLVAQPDLGTAVILSASLLVVLYAGGVPLAPLGKVAGVAAVGTVALAAVAPYRWARVKVMFDPWADPLGKGWQTLQSLGGAAEGGIYGVGLGGSRAKWGFLPHAHTDFVYAVIAEEAGLIGGLVVLGLFVALAVVGTRVALSAPDAFGRLLAIGITSWLSLQAIANIGGVLGVVPLTGVPLPFVSFGGSALVVALAGAGILASVARQGAR